MSRLFRRLNFAVASVSVLAVTACGPGGLAGEESSESSTPKPEKSLAKLDPCSILKPDDLARFDLEGPGDPDETLPSQPGCHYDGEILTATPYVNPDATVESLEKQDDLWAKFDRTDVNGRAGAIVVSEGSTEARICSTIFNAAEGNIKITASGSREKGLDECAESKKIAEAIEPRMPE